MGKLRRFEPTLSPGEIEGMALEIARRFQHVFASEAVAVLDRARELVLHASAVGPVFEVQREDAVLCDRVMAELLPLLGPRLGPVARPPAQEVATETRFRFRHDRRVVRLLMLAYGACTVETCRALCLERFGEKRTPSRSAIARFWGWLGEYAGRGG